MKHQVVLKNLKDMYAALPIGNSSQFMYSGNKIFQVYFLIFYFVSIYY